jgi:DNA adenine methylase
MWMKKEVPTLVKWPGGKKQLLEQFKPLFPKKITTYLEPFVGGGAIAFYIIQKYKPRKVVLSDINEELINVYTIVRDQVDELIELLKKYKKKHDDDFYYDVRAQDPAIMSDVTRAARFIYLNKTCFNGMYRVNSSGKFNVPIGDYKNPGICSENDLKEVSKILKKVKLECMPFEKIMKYAKRGNFIYFDPPYHPLNGKPSFTTYSKEKFLREEQKNLFEIFKKLDKRGCKVMLSNSDTEFIDKLYEGYRKDHVSATRMVNCDATKRGMIKELVIRNKY